MRVLTISSAYPSSPDNPRGVFIHDLAAALARAGVRVTVLAPGADGFPQTESRDGVQVQRVNYWFRGRQRLALGGSGIVANVQRDPLLLAQVPSLVIALRRAALRSGSQFDVIHAHWAYPAGVAGAAAARKHRKPFVVTSHGGDLNLSKRVAPLRWLVRRVCRAADACVAVSEAMMEEFVSQGVPRHKVHFIPLGLPPVDSLQPGRLPSVANEFAGHSGLRIIYVGNLTKNKAVHVLLEAHRMLEQRGYEPATLIVGGGPTAEALQGLISSHRLRNVTLCGPQSREDTLACMRSGQVLVLPSLAEGRGLVLLEAMSQGLVVMASDIPGPRELVHPGLTGMRFPAGNSAALADCLEELITCPDLITTLGAGGRRWVQDADLTAERCAREHVELYQRLLASS